MARRCSPTGSPTQWDSCWAEAFQNLPSPPSLILFINSICNRRCEHGFYWASINRKDDLTFEELVALNESLGRVENLNVSSGEPFLRPEFSGIVRQYIQSLWATREDGRYGSLVEPMLQYAKTKSVEKQTQVASCKAGVLSAVVYANGDVSVCELPEPRGNLRQQSFWQIWNGDKARARREKIACKECWCTTEVFLWPIFTCQPTHMLETMLGGKVWRKPKPLDPKDRLVVKLEDA